MLRLPFIVSVILASAVTAEIVTTTNPPSTTEFQDEYVKNCIKICENAGTEPEFDPDTFLCKCVIVAHVDDIDLSLIEKVIQHHGPTPSENSGNATRTKRKIGTLNGKKLHSKADPIHKDPIVGQIHTPLYLKPHAPLIHEKAALHELEEIRHRLRTLAHHPGARDAAARADAIRHGLRGLPHRLTVLSPEQRAKANVRAAEIRQRQRMLRRKAGLLGVTLSEENTTDTPQKGKKVNYKKNKYFSDEEGISSENHRVITQPKEYMDDD